MMNLMIDLSYNNLNGQIMSTPYQKQIQSADTVTLFALIDKMFANESYFPVEGFRNVSQLKKWIDSTITDLRLKNLLLEYDDRFIRPEEANYRNRMLRTPLLKAWFDCCLITLIGQTTESQSFSQQVLSGIESVQSFAQQWDQTREASPMLANFLVNITEQNAQQLQAQLVSHLALIDSWNRGIVAFRDKYFDIKLENHEYIYGAYKWCFAHVYAKSKIEGYEYSDADEQIATGFYNKLTEIFGQEKTKNLYEEYKIKREHTDKRTKQAQVVFS